MVAHRETIVCPSAQAAGALVCTRVAAAIAEGLLDANGCVAVTVQREPRRAE